MRTLIKSSGYKSVVDDAPPAIPARKDEIGSGAVVVELLLWDAAAETETDEGCCSTGDGMMTILLYIKATAEQYCS